MGNRWWNEEHDPPLEKVPGTEKQDVTRHGGEQSGMSEPLDVENGYPIDKGRRVIATDPTDRSVDVEYWLMVLEQAAPQKIDDFLYLVVHNGQHPSAAYDNVMNNRLTPA